MFSSAKTRVSVVLRHDCVIEPIKISQNADFRALLKEKG